MVEALDTLMIGQLHHCRAWNVGSTSVLTMVFQPDVQSLFSNTFLLTDPRDVQAPLYLAINHKQADYSYWYKKQLLGVNYTKLKHCSAKASVR